MLTLHDRQCFFLLLTCGLYASGCDRPADAPNPADAAQNAVEFPATSPTALATEAVELPTVPSVPVISATNLASRLGFYTVDQYGDDRNADDDLAATMTRATTEKKRIILQVGGEWCGWCKLLTGFIEKNEAVRSSLGQNYLLMKVTYTQKQPNEAFLSKYPKIKGYPHLFVLDAAGNLLHSQDTGELEEGKGYNESKVLEFLESWKPKS